jgi:hypothetical protein
MPYIGKSPVSGGFHKLDNLTASATATYALTLGGAAYYPETANHLIVSLNGVTQAPQDSFTVSGSNLVFDSALTASDTIDYIIALGDVYSVGTPSDGTITAVKLDSGFSSTLAKLNTAQSFTAAQRGSTDTDTTNTGNVTLDFDTNQNFVLTLTGNITLVNPTTEAIGQSGFIVFIQDATGSRTVSLGTDYETAGGSGITLSTAASTTDIVPYVVVASNRILLGAPQLAFA